jgi:hypothetical protein
VTGNIAVEGIMFGWSDLKERITVTDTSVECPVRGCAVQVPRQRRPFRAANEFRCRHHPIFISARTFEYVSERENMLWVADDDLALWERIKAPGVKRESRMARDNSEDAVTWNVFRYLERHGLIADFVNLVARGGSASDPRVIYWSFCQRSQKPWQPLLHATSIFSERDSRRSEPDIIIDDEELLVFAENKWLSGNRTRPSDTNDPKRYPTGGDGWFKRVFAASADFRTIAVDERLYELMRLWLIGSLIADRLGKKFLLEPVSKPLENSERASQFQ